MIINIRGTSGSGKSHLARSLLKAPGDRDSIMKEGRRQPYIELLAPVGGGPELAIPGHYNAACGGCDTINGLDEIYEQVRWQHELGRNVLFEGLIVCSDARRLVDLSKDLGRDKVLVIFLDTPIEECLASVQSRRAERGNLEPLNPKNTISKHKTNESVRKRFLEADVWVEDLSRAAAFDRCRELLELRNEV